MDQKSESGSITFLKNINTIELTDFESSNIRISEIYKRNRNNKQY